MSITYQELYDAGWDWGWSGSSNSRRSDGYLTPPGYHDEGVCADDIPEGSVLMTDGVPWLRVLNYGDGTPELIEVCDENHLESRALAAFHGDLARAVNFINVHFNLNRLEA